MCWFPGSHDTTIVFPVSFTNNTYSFIGFMWIESFCEQGWTKTVSSITTNCVMKHCMGSSAGLFVIGY